MGLFADSGLITRGMGFLNKLLTRGLGERLDIKGVVPVWKNAEYSFNVLASINKSDSETIGIFCPVSFIAFKEFNIFSQISKTNVKNFNVCSKVNPEKMIEILEII